MALTVAELRALFTADSTDIDRTQDRIRKDTQKTQGVLKTATGTMAGFLGASVVQSSVRGVVGFLKSTAAGASDLNETLSMSTVIFGRNEAAQEKWAASAWKSAGLSKQAALDTAASFGDMFAQLGFSADRAARMSRATVQLAADLGSFKNLPTADVTDMIAGALRGEYDALQRVIPNISAARVETKALAMTHKSAAKDLTAAEKAAATLAIIHHDGARAAGDFARTSSGAANQQKILTAQVDNLKTKIGTALLPAYRGFFQYTNDKVVPAVNDFIDGMKDGTGAGGDFVDMLHQAVDVGRGVLSFFNAIPGPIKKYGLELAVVGFGMSKVTGGIDGARKGIGGFVADLSSSDTMLQKVGKASYALGGALRNVAGAGGLLAVQDGLSRTNHTLGVFEATLGATAAGFAVGGPIGAGVGAGVGLFMSLKNAISGTNDVKMPSPEQLGLTDIITGLDEANAKATKFTRNQLFDFLRGKTKGAPPLGMSVGTTIRDTAKLYGIPDKVLVDAMTGNVKAFESIKARLRKAMKDDPNGMASEDWDTLIGSIRTAIKAYHDQQRAVREAISANGDYKELLKGFPKELVTKIEAVGLPTTEAGVARLARKMNLTPKQIQTIIEAVGIPTTLGKVQKIVDRMNAYAKMHPTATVDADTKPARDKVSLLVKDLRNLLSGNFTALVNVHTTGGGGGGKGGGKAGGGKSDGRFAGGRGSSMFRSTATAAMSGLTGTPLEILEQRQQIRDMQRELAKKNKKGKFVVRGLDRQVIQAQLDEARTELTRLMSAAVNQEALDAAKQAQDAYTQAVASIADQLKSSQSIFSTGTTSATQLLKNMRTDQVTNSEWASMLAALSKAGLSKTLLDEFITNGPSTQALKLGKSILRTGNIADLNNTSDTLAKQDAALGDAGVSGNLSGLGGPLFTIGQFNTYGMTPDEVAQRLYFTAQVQR